MLLPQEPLSLLCSPVASSAGSCGQPMGAVDKQGAQAVQRCPAASGGLCAAGNTLQGDIHMCLGW